MIGAFRKIAACHLAALSLAVVGVDPAHAQTAQTPLKYGTGAGGGKVPQAFQTGDVVGVANGGSGNDAFTSHCVLVAEGTGSFVPVCGSAAGQILTWNSSGDPSFQALGCSQLPSFTGDVTNSGCALAIGANKVTLADLAQIAANTVISNWTGSTANPAANTYPSCADTGGNHLNYVNGTGITCGSSSSGGGSGAITLISEVVTSGSQASVTFSSISSSYRDLIIKVRGRSAATANNDEVRAQFNGDTGTNYWTELLDASNTSVSGVAVNETSVRLGLMTADSATANMSSVTEALIGDYRGTVYEKATIGRSSVQWGTPGTSILVRSTGGHWRSTGAITSVKVFPSTGPFKDNTVVSLYGSL